MIRAKSALPFSRKPSSTTSHHPYPLSPTHDPSLLSQQLHHQSKKSHLLDADRTDFYRHAEDLKQKNRQQIQKLKVDNYKLKVLRDELNGVKKLRGKRVASGIVLGSGGGKENMGGLAIETTDENYWRRQFDKEKHSTGSKKTQLLNLQSLLEELEDNKTGLTEESPLIKNIRVLENRLDKVMIAYNEAQSIRKTYQQISRRLREERIKYDNELATIEKTLKGKAHDYEQLLLLAHDATHAKQLALGQFKKFQTKKQSVDQLRTKYLKQKRSQLQFRKFTPKIQTYKQKQKKIDIIPTTTDTYLKDNIQSFKQQSTFQKQQLSDYEDAYRKLKEVTGVLDANQIIQKFKTQGMTTMEFERQKGQYQGRIGELKREWDGLRERLDGLKFREEREKSNKLAGGDKSQQPIFRSITPTNTTTCPISQLDHLSTSLLHIHSQRQKTRLKQSRLQSILISIKAGTKHIASSLQFYKIPNSHLHHHPPHPHPQQQHGTGLPYPETAQQNALQVIAAKMTGVYRVVMNDPDYQKEKEGEFGLMEGYGVENKNGGGSQFGYFGEGMKNVRVRDRERDRDWEEEESEEEEDDWEGRKAEGMGAGGGSGGNGMFYGNGYLVGSNGGGNGMIGMGAGNVSGNGNGGGWVNRRLK